MIQTRNLIATIFILAGWHSVLTAQDEWQPPEPKVDEFAWVQLKSGEWLKGDIIAMQDELLIFESDELDTLELDLDDIKIIRSAKAVSTRIGEKEIIVGTLLLKDDEVNIRHAGELVTYTRAELMAIVPTNEKSRAAWKAKASLGSTVRRGNLDQTDFTARAEIIRRTPTSRFTFDYLGEYRKTDDSTTTDNHRVTSRYDMFITSRLFARAPFFEYLSDPFQNLEYRITGGAAIGYDFIVGSKVDWTMTLGPGYQYTKFDSVESGQDPKKDAAAVVFTSEYEWDITSDLTFSFDYSGQFTRKEVGETAHHAEARFEIDVTNDLDLDVSFIWDYTGNPVPSEGSTPDQNDFRLITAIGYEF